MTVSLRDTNLEKLASTEFDVLIVGGGINGAVSAASLAGRGVRVALIDRDDFASGVSSNSSNLAWGGIKYMESLEFLLVDKLCRSRNRLMRAYPSTVKEVRFLTTIARGFRFPPFFVYLGSLLYWVMGRFATSPPRYHRAGKIESTEPIINTSNAAGGLEYSDCYLYDNDARFVWNFVRRSLDYGCIAANYVRSDELTHDGERWNCQATDQVTGKKLQISARAVLNAAGPHVDALNRDSGTVTSHHHLFSKGVHLVVDQITDNKRVLAFFASDGRLFFLIPMGPKTCIGTTDTQVQQPEVGVTDEDRDFILENANAVLDVDPPLTCADIISERVGVRPLVIEGEDGEADWVQLSRKHVIEVDEQKRHMSVFGGKLTDCLNVGDEVADLVSKMGIEVPEHDNRWYGEPGKDLRDEFMLQAKLMHLDELTDSSSSEPLSERFWRRYGEAAFVLLERIREDEDCVTLLIENAEYTRCEIELAARREMIVTLEDFMRRRSKIELVVRAQKLKTSPGLHEACEILFPGKSEERLNEYLQAL